MMTAREVCKAMADTFEEDLSTSRAVYADLPKDQFDEIGVVVVKAKAVEMLINNLRILRDILPPDQGHDPFVDEAREIFGEAAAAQLIQLRKHQTKS